MGDIFLLFLIVLFAVAVITGEDFVFTLLYLFLGTWIAGRWWGQHGLKRLSVQRRFTSHAFLGEQISVHLELNNRGWLPLAWLQARESLPVALASSGPYQQVVSIAPRHALHLDYSVNCIRRGFYELGPLHLSSGDLLGLAMIQQRRIAPDYLTVFPKVIPLTRLSLPSNAPLGTLAAHHPVFEDPSRVFGKREYISGDSLRRVDWKTSATTGRLQVKLFEPSIALEVAIFVNLNATDYTQRARYEAAELAIVVAASLANWVIGARQAAGLVSNGADPLNDNAPPLPLPPRRGRGHLLRLLETLARLQVAETRPFCDLFQEQTRHLSWGATLVVVTSDYDEKLFDALFQARRLGLQALLVQCGSAAGWQTVRAQAATFGFPLFQFSDERDLDVWRK